MSRLISICLCLCLYLLIAGPVTAQQTLDELLEKVSEISRGLSNDKASAGIVGDPATIELRLSQTRQLLAAAISENEQLNRQLAASQNELEQTTTTLSKETASLTELFAVLRQHAADATGALNGSLVSAQLGLRTGLPTLLAQPDHIPAPDQLQAFHQLMLEEMVQSGKVARFQTEVVNATGIPATTEVVRVGMFNLIADNRFLRFELNNGTIQELARQPARRYRRDALTLFNANVGITAMAIDPTGGQLLGLLIQTPGLTERVEQGGPVGYIIIFLGLAGFLIGGYRLTYLGLAGARINRQLKSTTPSPDNALGRILSVYSQNSATDTDTLELKLDEAIIRETPELEKWQVALKVIAAVAPLLGLLGTVVGMIETFQQITLFGTSDPRLMADGISKALVTTMLGLVVAIPVVLIHSMVASRSKRLIEILEEQSAAIIATQAEKKS